MSKSDKKQSKEAPVRLSADEMARLIEEKKVECGLADPVSNVFNRVTVAEVNTEMSKEYSWLGNDVVGAMKCILRELVRARLEREKGVK